MTYLINACPIKKTKVWVTVIDVRCTDSTSKPNRTPAAEVVQEIQAGATIHTRGVVTFINLSVTKLACVTWVADTCIHIYPVYALACVVAMAHVAGTVVNVDLAVISSESSGTGAMVATYKVLCGV